MTLLGIILAYFWIIYSDFCFLSRLLTRAWHDRSTDRPTDRASYRGAMAHLKMMMSINVFCRFHKWVSKRQTNGRTDSDSSSDARTHLKRNKVIRSTSPVLAHSGELVLYLFIRCYDRPTDRLFHIARGFKEQQVTRGNNIVMDRWAGASKPHAQTYTKSI